MVSGFAAERDAEMLCPKPYPGDTKLLLLLSVRLLQVRCPKRCSKKGLKELPKDAVGCCECGRKSEKPRYVAHVRDESVNGMSVCGCQSEDRALLP